LDPIRVASTLITGIEVQLCGAAHCANFGAFATPKRNKFFDLRDFDESLRGPWELDLKRFSASLAAKLRRRSLRLGSGAARDPLASLRP
jgi:uncharacterized protein (DUF2252 family)